jgi:hypothetical protein
LSAAWTLGDGGPVGIELTIARKTLDALRDCRDR